MADDSTNRASWVQVMVRLRVPADIPGAEILRFVERENPDLRSHLEFDYDYAPIPVRVRGADAELRERAEQFVVVRARIDPRHASVLRAASYVDHVSRDARLEPFEQRTAMAPKASRIDCGGALAAGGRASDVARTLGVTRLWRAGLTGRGVVVGVVDGGITAHGRTLPLGTEPAIPRFPAEGEVTGGWPIADWGTNAEGWGQHGNMIAFDVQAMAPEAELWDVRNWVPQGSFGAYASNAVQGYRIAIDSYRTFGYPQILVNSWGLYDSVNGPDYAFDPRSPVALAVEEAIDAGILVLFAAGNCGDGCPYAQGTPCGIGNRGPGASILGPNGHPEVMTVGAATLAGEWCGYTSQGPAVLPPNDPDKPDFCSISQFDGFFPNESGLRPYDGGTSAATGIAGGVVALLKQARPDLTQEECKRVLRDTAQPIRTPAAYEGAGAGIIDAFRAFRSL